MLKMYILLTTCVLSVKSEKSEKLSVKYQKFKREISEIKREISEINVDAPGRLLE